jgi:general secretion pathway protein D
LSQETVTVTTDSRGVAVGQRITDLSNVRSTVLVPSNSTIVIGGMISSRDESFTRKAPLLGDLPVVGSLFRYDSRSSIRTELLIFLTPRIINGAEEEECLKEIEMGRIHFIESEAEEAHGPLRAIPAPEDMFEEEHMPWIQQPSTVPAPSLPSIPLSPTLQPTPTAPQARPQSMPLPPAPLGSPEELPAPSAPGQPGVPPAPPLPDPDVTRLKSSRLRMTEEDVTNGNAAGKVTPAKYTAPAAAKSKKLSILKKRAAEQSN